MPIRVLICGSRDFALRDPIAEVIGQLQPSDVVVHGAARGADALAAELAEGRGLSVVAFPANWKRYGRRAGPLRNERMLCEGRPDIGFAFPLAHSRGTLGMMARLRGAGVIVVSWAGQGGQEWQSRARLSLRIARFRNEQRSSTSDAGDET